LTILRNTDENKKRRKPCGYWILDKNHPFG
jgi:hypothetical protein